MASSLRRSSEKSEAIMMLETVETLKDAATSYVKLSLTIF